MIIRGNENLTKYGESQLAALVSSCLCAGIDAVEWQRQVDGWQGAGRMMVRKAAVAFDMLASLLTEAHVIEPSPESRVWSDMEGGHIFYTTPKISVADLICGRIDTYRR